jgi:hypothetical protein
MSNDSRVLTCLLLKKLHGVFSFADLLRSGLEVVEHHTVVDLEDAAKRSLAVTIMRESVVRQSALSVEVQKKYLQVLDSGLIGDTLELITTRDQEVKPRCCVLM